MEKEGQMRFEAMDLDWEEFLMDDWNDWLYGLLRVSKELTRVIEAIDDLGEHGFFEHSSSHIYMAVSGQGRDSAPLALERVNQYLEAATWCLENPIGPAEEFNRDREGMDTSNPKETP